MAVLSREQFLQKRAVRTEDVPVPEWGADAVVRVRGLTGRERDAWETSFVEIGSKKPTDAKFKFDNIRARLVALCVVDEAGERLFSDADAQAIGEQDGAVLDRIFEVAKALSGLSDTDIDDILGKFRKAPSID